MSRLAMTKNNFEQSNSYKHNGDLFFIITLSILPRVSLKWRDLEQPKADWLLPHRLWYFTCDVSRFSMLHDASSKLRCFPARCDMPCSYVFLKERYALSSHFPFSPLPNGISSWGMMKKSDKPRNSSFRIHHVDCLVSALSDLSTRFNLIPCLSMHRNMRLIRFYHHRYTLSSLPYSCHFHMRILWTNGRT